MTVNSLFAGAAKVLITPALGTRINGDFISHYATTIHDDLYCKTLILRRDPQVVLFIIVDTCTMSKEFIDEVKDLVATGMEISREDILMSSTHTHAGGSLEEVHLGAIDTGYRQKLPELIVSSVQKAWDSLTPAKIAFGNTSVPQHVICRRYYMKQGYQPFNPVTGGFDEIKTNPAGLANLIDHPVSAVDPGLSYLAVQGLDNRWISILANYSLHYVGDWDNGTITADYFGTFSKNLTKMLGNDFVAIMSNGTSGDVNIWDFQNPDRYPHEHFKKSELIGRDLAGKLVETLDLLEWEYDPEIRIHHEALVLPVRKPLIKELEIASEVVRTSNYGNYNYDDENLRKIYAREQMLLHETGDHRNLPLQVIRIGTAMIGGLPGEFFAETGLWLKQETPARYYFTIGLANGNVGYVPPAKELKRGGYETWRCRYSCLQENAEEQVRMKMREIMNSFQ